MEAINDIPETVLNAEIETEETETDLTLDAEIVPHVPWTKKSHKRYLGKLRMLGMIHAEIADEINAKREASWQAFFRPDDKYIPEEKDKKLYVNLHLGTLSAKEA